MTVSFGKTILEPDGYEPVDPIIEVLEDVGVLRDPDMYSTVVLREPDSQFFTVIIEAKPIKRSSRIPVP
jgi:hypothetical protein